MLSNFKQKNVLSLRFYEGMFVCVHIYIYI